MIRSPCARHTHFLYTSLLQSRQICASPLHFQLPGGPGTSLPFSGRRTQVSGVSRTGRVFLGLGHMSWCPLVSLGFAILQRVGKAARHCLSLLSRCSLQDRDTCLLCPGPKSSHPYSAFWTCEEEESLCLLFQGPGEWTGRLIYPPLPSS